MTSYTDEATRAFCVPSGSRAGLLGQVSVPGGSVDRRGDLALDRRVLLVRGKACIAAGVRRAGAAARLGSQAEGLRVVALLILSVANALLTALSLTVPIAVWMHR
jgi:hypothetical protein